MQSERDFRLVLVGAGHAHLHLVQNAARLRAAGIRPVLVAPTAFHYSGLATGVLSGALPVGENALDIARLAAACGLVHVPATADTVDPDQRIVHLTGGQALPYDAVSINVGSVVRDLPGVVDHPGIWTIKPLSRLVDFRAHVEILAQAAQPCPRIVVAGGGQSGFEIAAVLAGLCKRLFGRQSVTLISPDCSMPWAPPGAARALLASFRKRGVTRKTGRVTGMSGGVCTLDAGQDLPCDALILATGLDVPPPASNLPVAHDDYGRISVTPSLNVSDNPRIFAVGDCASIVGHPRPSLGVFGVRAAPVLLQNVCAMARGEQLDTYIPQKRWLSILDLGDETGLAIRDTWWSQGRCALDLKRWLDKRFLERIRRVYAP
jgi:NADH dehydrogenase FAD-containing subunit